MQLSFNIPLSRSSSRELVEVTEFFLKYTLALPGSQSNQPHRVFRALVFVTIMMVIVQFIVLYVSPFDQRFVVFSTLYLFPNSSAKLRYSSM